jgi:hypothetical protein
MSPWFGSSAASAAAPTQAELELQNAQVAVKKFSWFNLINPTPEYTAAKDAETKAQKEVDAEKAAKAAAAATPVTQTGGKRRKSAGGKRKKNTGGKSRKVKKEKK